MPLCFLVESGILLLSFESCVRYELIKLNRFRGLSLSIVQLFSKQVIHSLLHVDVNLRKFIHRWMRFSVPVVIRLISILDIAWIGSYERCWYNSLWPKARKHSVMHKHQVSSSWWYWTVNCVVTCSSQFLVCIVKLTGQQKSKSSTLDQPVWKIGLFILIYRQVFSRVGCIHFQYWLY